MTKSYCDKCGILIGIDGLHGKLKRGPGKLAGHQLDLCGEHAVEMERFILGRPDEDRGNTAKARTPRKPRPRPTPGAAA